MMLPKRSEEQEYTLHLFEKCSLGCGFCWQSHDVTVGTSPEDIVAKAEIVYDLLETEPLNKITVNLMGGEIFDDQLFGYPVFWAYMSLMLRIEERCQELGKTVRFNLVTNMAFENHERVTEFLGLAQEYFPSRISVATSFDPRGRFNRKTLKTFVGNITRYHNIIGTVSVLMTKPNLEWIMSEAVQEELEQKHLDPDNDEAVVGIRQAWPFIYKNFYTYFDYYAPDRSAEQQMPSDKLLLKFWIYMIEKYPRSDPMRTWTERHQGTESRALSCRTTKTILPDGTPCTCGKLVEGPMVNQFYAEIREDNNQAIEDSFMERRGCTTCEYLNRCQMGCFVTHEYKEREELERCVYKYIYDYVEHAVVETPGGLMDVGNSCVEDVYAIITHLPVIEKEPSSNLIEVKQL